MDEKNLNNQGYTKECRIYPKLLEDCSKQIDSTGGSEYMRAMAFNRLPKHFTVTEWVNMINLVKTELQLIEELNEKEDMILVWDEKDGVVIKYKE